jgi:hypothetical protein
MGDPNKILTSANAPQAVSNLSGAHASTSTLQGVPLGTANGAATGELGAKVVVVGQGASGTPLSITTTDNEYETVAASQTAQVLGATGATGDFLAELLVIPATTSPGAISILDNATSITVFTGGATSVVDLRPFTIPLGITSVSGAWKVTTGANVSVIGIGNFT